jgi:phage baseplate assembly protein W
MSTPRHRAWRFLHPDLDAPEAAAGLRLSPRGSIEAVDESASVRQAVLLLLSTVPGERVMRPDYGCHLHRLAFAPNDPTTHGLAIHYVRRALERWEPRIEILKIDAAQNPAHPERLDILLQYRVRSTQHVTREAFSLNLMGEEG